MRRSLVTVLVAFFVLAAASVAWAQFVPDSRYNGYPKTLVAWPAGPPDLVKCEAEEYYEPSDLHLVKYADRVRVARVRTQESDECTWMLTRYKWRWVLRPAGTRVAMDSRGRDLFDFGSPKGDRCANPRPFSVAITPPEPVAQPAPKEFFRMPPTPPIPPASPTPSARPLPPACRIEATPIVAGALVRWSAENADLVLLQRDQYEPHPVSGEGSDQYLFTGSASFQLLVRGVNGERASCATGVIKSVVVEQKRGICSGKRSIACVAIPAVAGAFIGWRLHQGGQTPTKVDPGGGKRPE